MSNRLVLELFKDKPVLKYSAKNGNVKIKNTIKQNSGIVKLYLEFLSSKTKDMDIKQLETAEFNGRKVYDTEIVNYIPTDIFFNEDRSINYYLTSSLVSNKHIHRVQLDCAPLEDFLKMPMTKFVEFTRKNTKLVEFTAGEPLASWYPFKRVGSAISMSVPPFPGSVNKGSATNAFSPFGAIL